jgi:hypothetical protein
MGAGPLSVPTGSPGSSANALAQVREAIKILEAALPSLQTGSDPYKAVLQAISSMARHVSPADEVPGVQQTALRGIQNDAGKGAMMQSLMRSMAGPGGGGPPGGAPGPGGGAQPPGA